MKPILVLGIVFTSAAVAFNQNVSSEHTVTKKFYLIQQTASWYNAFYHCRSNGMQLASILSQEENDQIKQQIRNEGLEQHDFWISGYRLGANGLFKWMGSGKPLNFTDWKSGQPDIWRNPGGIVEDCMHLWADYDLEWKDGGCYKDYLYFACEEEVIQHEWNKPREYISGSIFIKPNAYFNAIFCFFSFLLYRIVCFLSAL